MQIDESKIRRIDMPEVMWLQENQEFLEENYPSKWVAVKGRELIAVGDSPRDVMREAQKKGITDPHIKGIRSAKYRGAFFVG
jgi:hypothetical protein